MCARQCPAGAITQTKYIPEGHKLASYEINTAKCIKCGACMGACRKGAISKR